jgi:DNA polymerase-3 subunit epsilon
VDPANEREVKAVKPSIDQGCFPTGLHYPGIAHLLRVAAIGIAEELAVEAIVAELPIVAIDTETTGRDPLSDRIVELAAVIYQGKEIIQRVSWLINPGRPIPQEASEVHKITDADVADKPTFGEVMPAILALLEGKVPLAYNAEFDRQFLIAECDRCGSFAGRPVPALRRNVEWLDPLVWAREIQREEKSRALGDVCQRLGIALDNAHRATDDAEAALKVMIALLPDARVPRMYGGFLQEQRRLARQQGDERARWRRERAATP